MPEDDVDTLLPGAVQDFHRARRRAAMQELIGRLTGEPVDLLSYEEVRQRLKANARAERGLRDIPISAIIGSVGRYNDFTRDFLPRQVSDAHRWARIKIAATGLTGLPPIEVYQIGEVYFVRDGNHRVSVARELGSQYIQAYVTEIQTDVPLTTSMNPDDLILKAEHAEFIRWADIRRLLPGVDLTLTAPGKYDALKEHISVHRYYMGLEQQREIPLSEAVAHWYETVYRPVVDAIQSRGILRDFPERTEADLYLWLAEHRSALQHALGWQVEPGEAAEDLAEEFSTKPERVLARVGEKIANALAPEGLGLTASPPGEWREKRVSRDGEPPRHLFRNILVTLDGRESGWLALDQALELARCEEGRILGLHVVPSQSDRQKDDVVALNEGFEQRCRAAGIQGELAISAGPITHQITQRARWADLVVAPLNFPPGTGPIAKLRSGFRTMIVSASCPVLAIPTPLFPLSSVLLAYDGSPKSREALFVATYMASNWPEIELVVLSSGPEKDVVMRTLDTAASYLEEHDVTAELISMDLSDVAAGIREVAEAHNSSVVVMGGYGYNAVLEVMLGSTVNDVLRTTRRPTLICR